MKKVFPGAEVSQPGPNEKGFTAANRSTVPNLGSALIPARTIEGDDLTTNWKNADVAMPILSTKKRAIGGKGIWYHEHGGSLVNPKKGINSEFVESGGVYFIKILVPKTLTQKGHPPPKAPPKAQGFVWPGAVKP